MKSSRPRQMDREKRTSSQEDIKELALSRLNDVLTKSLAAYVILQSKEPVSQVINDLYEIEITAAKLIGAFYSDNKKFNLKGALASVVSFIPNPEKQNLKKAAKNQKIASKTQSLINSRN